MSTLVIPRTPPLVFGAYGMGTESTAWLHRILTYPQDRPREILADYSNLVIVTAQTGDEWSVTGELVIGPRPALLRQRNVRFVELASKGPSRADGVAVLQDSRQPYRVHLEGVYKLSCENQDSGTIPILSGHHTCAQKSKGEPMDWWRAREVGDAPYCHFIGYSAEL